MPERQFVKVTVEERVATITIDHPPVNAFDRVTMRELNDAIDEVLGHEQVKAVVVTGAGQIAFVAGADINELKALAGSDSLHEALLAGQAVFNRIERAHKPFIAAINGVCLGGGLELAMACHMRIAGDRVKLGQAEINLGIIPGWGGTQRLSRIVGRAKATEMILTGDAITAQEAYRLNLVNRVVPAGEVLKTARDLARKLAVKPGMAVAAALQAIDQGLDMPLDQALAQEARLVGQLAYTEDMREGATAFLEKRQPQFKDR
jgi:enoyl-CoA hydratase/carnithine racemase